MSLLTACLFLLNFIVSQFLPVLELSGTFCCEMVTPVQVYLSGAFGEGVGLVAAHPGSFT